MNQGGRSVDHAVSVVIACHAEERWESIGGAVRSALAQCHQPAAVILAVDHNPRLAARARTELSALATRDASRVTVVENADGRRGASPTRNRGMAEVTTPLAAFLDDDETAASDWLEHLLAPFDDADVIGTGGRYAPLWHAGKPVWFPDEFAWVVGGAFTGMPTTATAVRNVWSGNMAVRTSVFRAVGGFRTEFGKVEKRSRPEDTDLCIRMSLASEGGRWIYVPDAVIDHFVPADRGTLRYFARRCFAEGRGKIALRRSLHHDPLGDERDYVRRTLPQGLLRNGRQAFSGASRAGAIALGITCAGTGAATEVLVSLRMSTRQGA